MLDHRQMIDTSSSAMFLELMRVTITAVEERVNDVFATTRMVNVVVCKISYESSGANIF